MIMMESGNNNGVNVTGPRGQGRGRGGGRYIMKKNKSKNNGQYGIKEIAEKLIERSVSGHYHFKKVIIIDI